MLVFLVLVYLLVNVCLVVVCCVILYCIGVSWWCSLVLFFWYGKVLLLELWDMGVFLIGWLRCVGCGFRMSSLF